MVDMGTHMLDIRLQQRPPHSMLAVMLRVIPRTLCLVQQVLVAQGEEPQFQAISYQESSTIQHYQVIVSEDPIIT
jgi:hypothetical protein